MQYLKIATLHHIQCTIRNHNRNNDDADMVHFSYVVKTSYGLHYSYSIIDHSIVEHHRETPWVRDHQHST